MPKSVIVPAKQHAAFQKTGFTEIHEFSAVGGLFKVPSCVLVADSKAKTENVPLIRWSGELMPKQRNVPLEVAKTILRFERGEWSPLSALEEMSPYYEHVINGATIYPRSFWFAEPPSGQPINLKAPFLRTPKDIKSGAKGSWKRLGFEGKVESEFLFGTVLAGDLLPFALRRLRLVVLPLLKRADCYVMLTPDDILAEDARLLSGKSGKLRSVPITNLKTGA